MKLSSPSKPRLVVYLSADELKRAKLVARSKGMTAPSTWLGTIMRLELAKLPAK